MKQKVVTIDPNHPDRSIIKQAAELIASGNVVICPTDTVYILATNALNLDAIKKIFIFKGRDERKPIHINVRDRAMAEEVVDFNNPGELVFNKLLPGPITIVLPKKSNVPDSLTGGLKTLGLRIPANAITQAVSSICLVPYTTTSANPAGGKNPYSLEDIISQFDNEVLGKIDLILDAGPLPPTPPSTVVDLSSGEPVIIRKGPISLEQIQEAIPKTRTTF